MGTRQVALTPRAKLVAALGQDLISSDTVAVIELVKNAYDADASHVTVTFHGPLEEGAGRIEILDDGHGMTSETILESWMQPATGHKRSTARSEGKKRRMLGEKGIGRFATQRLGHRLVMTTRRAGDESETVVAADWKLFDDESKLLSQVKITVSDQTATTITRQSALGAMWSLFKEKRRIESGTLLSIEGLRHDWNRVRVQQLQRGLSRLIAPDADASSGFRVWLVLPAPFADLSGPIQPPPILEVPLYTLTGRVSSTGRVRLQLSAKGLKAVRSLETDWVWSKPQGAASPELVEPVVGVEHDPLRCGEFSFEIRIWDREESDLRPLAKDLGGTVRDLRRDLDEFAGISVYRDGFRVLPFGEQGNDWLGLDHRRVQNPTLRLSNNQVVGYIKVTRAGNRDIKDQTNRQGLIENDAYSDLCAATTKALAWAEEQRYDIRSPAREEKRRTPSLFDRKDIEELTSYVASEHQEDRKLKALVNRVESRAKEIDQHTQEAIARYRRLANLGTLIDKTLHDVRTPVSFIRGEAHLGHDDAKANLVAMNGFAERMLGRFVKISGSCEVLSTVTRRLAPLAGRKPGRPRETVFEEIIKSAFEFFNEEIEELGIEVQLPSTQNTVTVEPGEVSQVFYNLIDNSIFWLRRVQRGSRAIHVQVRRRGESLVVDFSDSGPGVSDDVKDRIFEPYFSTKPDGTGLGLAIAGEIVEDYYGGMLELLDRGELPGATFRVTFKRRV